MRDRYRRVDLAREFQIDANRVNSRGTLSSMNRLEKWHADGVVRISMADVAQEEAALGSSSRARKAFSRIFFDTADRTLEEEHTLEKITEVLFPAGAKNPNERNDALIVFSAWKHNCTLITNDGASRSQPRGILGNREGLADLGVTVISDLEAVSWVVDRIRERDEQAVLMHRNFDRELPCWVGKD